MLLLMENIRRSPVDMVNIPLCARVSHILGGAGFLPSTVVGGFNTQSKKGKTSNWESSPKKFGVKTQKKNIWNHHLHPWNLTWNLKRSPWERRFLLETIHFQVPCQILGGSSYLRHLTSIKCPSLATETESQDTTNLTSSLTACRHSNESSLQTYPPHNGPRWNVTKIQPCLDCFRHWTLDFHTICLGWTKIGFPPRFWVEMLGWEILSIFDFSGFQTETFEVCPAKWQKFRNSSTMNSVFILKKGCEAKKTSYRLEIVMRYLFVVHISQLISGQFKK